MFLVDTSVWVGLFNGKATPFVIDAFEDGQLCLTSVVYFEVLQGIKKEKIYQKIKNILCQQKFYGLHHEHHSYEKSAEIYRKCRQNGITPRSTIDCLIAQCAIDNNIILLHNDKDFIQMAKVTPLLKQQSI